MKKVSILFLTGIFVLSLISCGGSDKKTSTKEDNQQEKEKTEKKENKNAHLQNPEEVAKHFLEAYKNRDYATLGKYVTPNQRAYYSEKNPDINRWVTDENIKYLEEWEGEFREVRYTKDRSNKKQAVYFIKDIKEEGQQVKDYILTMKVAHYQDDYNYKEPVWMITNFSGIDKVEKEEYQNYPTKPEKLDNK
jgi:hypothetical protein